MSNTVKPHPRNIHGDFYVEDGCCTACDVPFYYAPNLFKYDETEMHCFVAKQPTDDDEMYQMIKATRASEVECIRYKGNEPRILRRLTEAGISSACDQQHLVRGVTSLLRNHVTFADSLASSELEIIAVFKEYILSQNAVYDRYKTTSIKTDQKGATFSFCWYKNDYYQIWGNKIESSGDLSIYHSPTVEPASRSISVMIDEWLKSDNRFTNIKWFSHKAREKSLVGKQRRSDKNIERIIKPRKTAFFRRSRQ